MGGKPSDNIVNPLDGEYGNETQLTEVEGKGLCPGPPMLHILMDLQSLPFYKVR